MAVPFTPTPSLSSPFLPRPPHLFLPFVIFVFPFWKKKLPPLAESQNYFILIILSSYPLKKQNAQPPIPPPQSQSPKSSLPSRTHTHTHNTSLRFCRIHAPNSHHPILLLLHPTRRLPPPPLHVPLSVSLSLSLSLSLQDEIATKEPAEQKQRIGGVILFCVSIIRGAQWEGGRGEREEGKNETKKKA